MARTPSTVMTLNMMSGPLETQSLIPLQLGLPIYWLIEMPLDVNLMSPFYSVFFIQFIFDHRKSN